MTWGDLLKRLDALRSALRAEHGKELNKEIASNDALAAEIKTLMSIDSAATVLAPTATPMDDLLSCVPSEPVPEVKIQDVVYRGDGEGRMVILKRETPLIVREPVLDEVSEEELGK